MILANSRATVLLPEPEQPITSTRYKMLLLSIVLLSFGLDGLLFHKVTLSRRTTSPAAEDPGAPRRNVDRGRLGGDHNGIAGQQIQE